MGWSRVEDYRENVNESRGMKERETEERDRGERERERERERIEHMHVSVGDVNGGQEEIKTKLCIFYVMEYLYI